MLQAFFIVAHPYYLPFMPCAFFPKKHFYLQHIPDKMERLCCTVTKKYQDL